MRQQLLACQRFISRGKRGFPPREALLGVIADNLSKVGGVGAASQRLIPTGDLCPWARV
jgi:hypothetical protein